MSKVQVKVVQVETILKEAFVQVTLNGVDMGNKSFELTASEWSEFSLLCTGIQKRIEKEFNKDL